MIDLEDSKHPNHLDPLLKNEFHHSVDEKVSWANCWSHYYHGLSSSDENLRTRSKLIIYGNSCACGLLCVLLVLMFTVIIPAVMQSIVNDSVMELVSASISNPGNTSFSSSVLQKFTNAGSVSAKAKVNTLSISWSDSEILKLTNGNTITVANNKESTMNAIANVVNDEAMIRFNNYLIANPEAEWTIDGSLDITFLITSKVNFHKTVTLQGYNNFSIQPQILNTNVSNGLPTQLFIVADVTLFSESNVKMDFGQSLFFVMEVNGTDIGIGELPNFVMNPGPIDAKANLTLSYTNEQEYSQINYLISQFASGLDANATLKNFYLRQPVSWLSPALSTIRMDSVLPGCDTALVLQINLYMKKIPENLPFTLVLYNPQPLPLGISSIVGSLYYLNVKIALVNTDNLNIVVPPYTTITTGQIPSETVNTAAAAKAFSQFMVTGQGPVDLYSDIVGSFGEFVANINYVQLNVTMVLVN
jgi:hypothetical protein